MVNVSREIIYDFIEGRGKQMECPVCGTEMTSKLMNLTDCEQIWRCPECGHREVEYVGRDANLKRENDKLKKHIKDIPY